MIHGVLPSCRDAWTRLEAPNDLFIGPYLLIGAMHPFFQRGRSGISAGSPDSGCLFRGHKQASIQFVKFGVSPGVNPDKMSRRQVGGSSPFVQLSKPCGWGQSSTSFTALCADGFQLATQMLDGP